MDFELNDDQVALREAARAVLADLAAPERVRAHTEGGAAYDADLWAAMVEQGWAAVELREDRGGLGMGMVELTVLLEETGRYAAPAPFAPTVLAAGALEAAGATDLVDRLAGGEALGCVSWWPPDPASSRGPRVVAEFDRGGWRLSGRTAPIVAGPSADVAVVAADAGGEPALFAVELDGGSRPPVESAMDVTRQLGRLTLDASPARELGGAEAVDALVDRGATAMAALLLGGSDRVLEMAVGYAKERHQFGRPIGSFQAIKHKCADMLVDVEGMRSSAYWAAWCVGAGDEEATVAASTAKIWATDASKRVMTSGLQIHGGIGFTWEHDFHFFLKRAQLDQWSFGSAAWHRARLATRLQARVAAGEPVI